MTIKTACFTDLHLGKKNNSLQHNQDCLEFVTWFCDRVRGIHGVTHIVFLGDWFENRNSVNVLTMHFALECLALLNETAKELGLKVIFLVGNHDLFHRENRKIFSTEPFSLFSNITVVSEPVEIDGTLFSPFIFKEEYPLLARYNKLKYWYGHFEFRNFVVTASNKILDQGPDHTQFRDPVYIFTGHFHKRQVNDNVVYIGNAFPMDYGDAGDIDRGMMVCDHATEEVEFINWEQCPIYVKTRLSEVMAGEWQPLPKSRVRCLMDVDISYSEAQQLREALVKEFDLREFTIEENIFAKKDAIMEGAEVDDLDLAGLNESVRRLIEEGVTGTTTIDPKTLIDVYNELP